MMTPCNSGFHRAGEVAAGKTIYTDCPNCGYAKALAITRTGERYLYHCHAGCDQGELWQVVGQERPALRLIEKARSNPAPRREYFRSLWANSSPAVGSCVETYLAGRGLIDPIPAALRFLPSHLHKPSGTKWPVMLAAVTDAAGRLKGVHRTYLDHGGRGKAPVEPARMTLGAIAGFACHLGQGNQEIVVAEGIETGFSAQMGLGLPTWAALSAGGLRNLILPPLPSAAVVMIAADADFIGIKSARIAATRWIAEGRRVRIVIPGPLGSDFNDLLRAGLIKCSTIMGP